MIYELVKTEDLIVDLYLLMLFYTCIPILKKL